MEQELSIFFADADRVGWSTDADRRSTIEIVSKVNSFKIRSHWLRADVIYLFMYSQILDPGFWYVRRLARILGKQVVAVASNELSLNSDLFLRVSQYVDVWISPNCANSEFLKNHNERVIEIPFPVSSNIFTRTERTTEELTHDAGLTPEQLAGKFVIGSFQRDSLGSNLRAPRPQKNPDLLIEICRQLPNDIYVLLLAGPRRHYLIEKCIQFQIPYIFVGDTRVHSQTQDDVLINTLALEKIRTLYELCDLYIVHSLSESGPKAIFESQLMDVPILSTPVGQAVDFLSSSSIFTSAAQAASLILQFALRKPSKGRLHADPGVIKKVRSALDQVPHGFLSLAQVLKEQRLQSQRGRSAREGGSETAPGPD